MQQATTNVVQEIAQISMVSHNVNTIVARIATAVDEQAVTAKDMAQNIAQTAAASQAIARDMATVSAASTETGLVSTQLNTHALALTQVSGALREMVHRFQLESARSSAG